MMNVTVKIRRTFTDKAKLKAVASLCLDGGFIVESVKLIEGEKGYFLSFPSVKNTDGSFSNTCFPINNEFRTHLTDLVIDEYNKF